LPDDPRVEVTTPDRIRVHFGSLDIRYHTVNPRYVELLTPLFRIWPSPDIDAAPDLELVVVDGEECRPRVEQVEDIMRIESSGGTVRVTTAMTELTLDRDVVPNRAELVVHAAGQDPLNVEHYLVMVIHKLLQLFGRLRLHGAAVVLRGRTYVVLGDKGAGKSTLALALGRAGGTVLADDQLVVRYANGEVSVSGVDGDLRLTDETERHFFSEPIDAVPQDFAGTPKKEVPLAELVPAQPRLDHAPDVLLFSRVGTELGIKDHSRSAALHRIVGGILHLHRFAGADDMREFLGMVTAFVNAVTVYELTLSPCLGDLAGLEKRLAKLG
jgi:hypothetical protein